jgi:hypothetical protein
MSPSVARVPTASASRYLQQLAKHWSHRFAVTFDAQQAAIPFDTGARLEMAAEEAVLVCRLTVPAGGDVARMRTVVQEHLDRFAFREAPLSFDWQDEP